VEGALLIFFFFLLRTLFAEGRNPVASDAADLNRQADN